MTEHAYKQDLTAPAEVENATNRQLSDLAARDFDGVQIGVGLWDQWTDREKNVYGTMITLREGEPATHWHTQKAETPSTRTDNGIVYYVITETYTEGPIEACREMARGIVRDWLVRWNTSEFKHTFNSTELIFDINAQQETRLAASHSRGRAVGDAFVTSWYAKNGDRVDFPNRTTFEAFYGSYHKHLEDGNATFEASMTQIAGAGDTATLDSILNNLPPIPGEATSYATGPMRGAQGDTTATQPVITRDSPVKGGPA